MLKGLKLNREDFDKHIVDVLIEYDVGGKLDIVLKDFKNKVSSRRRQVTTFKKKLESKNLDEKLKTKYTEFIEKVGRIEKNYDQERMMIIRRSINESFENIGNKLKKELLG